MIHSSCCSLCGGRILPERVIVEGTIDKRARRQLALDLVGAPEDCGRFFATLFAEGECYRSACELAYDLAVVENTLNTRFKRAGLPHARRYVVGAMLVRIADARERVSLAETVDRLRLSSVQSVERTIRHLTQRTGTEFAREFTGGSRLEVFRAELVTPYLDVLREFRPLIERLSRAA